MIILVVLAVVQHILMADHYGPRYQHFGATLPDGVQFPGLRSSKNTFPCQARMGFKDLLNCLTYRAFFQNQFYSNACPCYDMQGFIVDLYLHF